MAEQREPPASKAELLHQMREGRAAWDALIAQVPETLLTEPLLSDRWSVKDLIAHIAAYEQWTAAQIKAAHEGRAPTNMELYGVAEMPPDPAGWDLDWQNAAIYARYKDLPLVEVRAFSRRAYEALLAAVEATSEEDLAKPGTTSWPLESSTLSVIPIQSYAHYEMHVADLRAIVGGDAV
jgi:hypothetical protein